MYHISHFVSGETFSRILVAYADVFVCMLYRYAHWTNHGMKELWVLHRQDKGSTDP